LGGLGAVGRKELRHRQSSLELHSVDAHLATSLTSGDDTINPARRRSCDCWLKVGANQDAFCTCVT
ncbi:hypothetical protein P2A91_21900, partial [Xanthomonas perforans]|uniref:hypothetical protein n=1 Tax=Xanthomonas perforans TaxID=442694 RepID=UPI0019D1F31F